ncbi:MAG: flagellar filament capping protein FliD, partial [Chloroflexi bacterium]|nr:flagellar filament capping protein FliD [Chloroflexota bacterium]
LKELQALVKPLTTTDPSSALTAGRAASVSNAAAGYTVLAASASNSAIAGAYAINVTTLAREHRVRSDQQTYSDQALNLSGTILVGGAAARSQTTVATIADTVTAFGTGSIASGQNEIGTATYYVETRNDATAGWQFRLVDADGKAASIQQATSAGTYTSNWQAIPTGGGSYDTGRGLTLTLGGDSGLYQAAGKGAGAAQASYSAQGASIAVAATDSLTSIASAINSAAYAEGNAVAATVVDRQLVLAAKDTGAAHAVAASDSSGTALQSLGVLTAGGAFKNVMQTAADASFTVNGLSVTRGKNAAITDVITGATLNLAADAEGRSATLTVSVDMSAARTAVENFVGKFNSVQKYLQEKTAVTAVSDGTTTTYTRGALANDSIFNDLRSDLFSLFMSDAANSGTLKNLRDIGLSINDSLQATVTDSAKLDSALATNLGNVGKLFDTLMAKFDTTLSRFTGASSGYLDSVTAYANTEMAEADAAIKEMNLRLDEKEQSLVNQFAEMQAQLVEASYQQQQWASIYGGFSRFV